MTVPTPPADPRTITPTTLGTPLRDAAVDPKPVDFLGPTNAGKAGELGNPHGPSVVSPELHAVEGTHPYPAGPVSSVAAEQDAKERAHLADWQPGI